MQRAYERAIRHVHAAGAFTPEMMSEAPIRALASEISAGLSKAIGFGYEKANRIPPDAITEGITANVNVFSGMKAFHEMVEGAQAMMGENGLLKPLNEAWNDVLKVNDTYNRTYFEAEYNFAQHAATMAAKWQELKEDGGGRYLIQYRTAGDDKVRPEHAELNGITLPASDLYWDFFLPPNGFNCRCYAVRVLASKYPQSNSAEAMRLGKEATAGKYADMFRNNAGKDAHIFNDYNPYTLRDCPSCISKIELAAKVPANELCKACSIVRAMQKEWGRKIAMPRKEAEKEAKVWFKNNLKERVIKSDALNSGELKFSYKSIDSILGHAKSAEAKWVATTLPDNADALRLIKTEKLGARKNMESEKDRKNVEAKEKRGVTDYNSYEYSWNGKDWIIGMERVERGGEVFEQPYYIDKKRNPKK